MQGFKASRPEEVQPVPGAELQRALRPLTPEQLRFEIDMCIGCDRCMRACPVPLSSKISIAELNKATIDDELSPLLVRFTDECVLCGSCVPVCPVDNHRDLLMLSLKERLGTSWENKADIERVRDMLPKSWSVSQLLTRLREQPMLGDEMLIPDNYLLHLVNSSQLRITQPGSWLMREGEFGRDLVLILSGRVEISSTGPGEAGLPLAVLRRGEYFGEHEMLSGQTRQTSAYAIGKCALLVIPEQVVQRLMEIVPEVRVFFESLHLERSIEAVLRRLPLLQGIATIDLRHLAEQAITRRYERGEQLFDEEDQDQPERETLHLLLDGFVKVARKLPPGKRRKERIIAYRQNGDYFAGGLDMLGDQRAVKVSAITRTTVAEVPRRELLNLFRRYPEVKTRFQQQLKLYNDAKLAAQSAIFEPFQFDQKQPATRTTSNAAARAGLHALVDDGVIEGTEVLVIDLAKCIHCNECEEACERRHGHSRMNRNGLVVGNISIATACRQCQDPVCMLCSRAGIARLPSGEVYITESCIGCGICAERCPYDNISIVDLEEQQTQRQGDLWQSFSTFFSSKKRKLLPVLTTPGPLDNTPPLDPVEEIRKKIAVKCDLCAGYNDQACVQACPTGAAIRVNPRTFFGSTEEILLK
ncbi:cyclic nucleotide-binding domain-containing protein [Ktedonobacter racemifer]|uniref:Cyclic nucleotide-binding protein n=1 Tax=Ktedonobacter racemifer DSM 44963 TaxID=485913 RepID=D6TRC1_KTERA|nr:cyclic nucleotide-binding domain-containing protein [Ktedonobacter racemifer]EFH87820.1 cyclic nucleotide-binding protein [Ktedonobacter racemifer DSM 44963]